MSPDWRVVLFFEDVPTKEELNDLVWRMRQAGRDHAGVPMPTYEEATPAHTRPDGSRPKKGGPQ